MGKYKRSTAREACWSNSRKFWTMSDKQPKAVLLDVTRLPVSDLERAEKLENLRMLENGIPVHLAVIDHVGISIDTEEDFLKAHAYLQEVQP